MTAKIFVNKFYNVMFDDQPKAGAAPGNLPVAEDIFADVEKGEEVAPTKPPDALSSGFLKRKETPGPAVTPVVLEQVPIVSNLRTPILGKILLAAIVIAVVTGIGLGGRWFYNRLFPGQPSVDLAAPALPSLPAATTPAPSAPAPTAVTPAAAPTAADNVSSNVSAKITNDKILFGQQIDTDKDGLPDAREAELGTDPNKADTDGDGLNDGDEVLLWKTNPLNPDTDGDGYPDGTEVANGYNPLGPGRLPNVPSSTAATSTK